MLKHLLYIIIGLGSLLCSTQSDSGIDDLPLAETEKILKEKTPPEEIIEQLKSLMD